MKTIYLVWNVPGSECVGFDDREDAEYAATGIDCSTSVGVSTLADAFRETFAYDEPDAEFQITEVEIDA